MDAYNKQLGTDNCMVIEKIVFLEAIKRVLVRDRLYH